MDALTIDIVAPLFDGIFQEPDLSAALRAQIASASICRDRSEEGRIADKVPAIVDEVVAGFDTELDIFDWKVKALEDFLQGEESRARSRTSEMVVSVDKLTRFEVT